MIKSGSLSPVMTKPGRRVLRLKSVSRGYPRVSGGGRSSLKTQKLVSAKRP